jgi:hypothetical protein
MNHVIQFNNLLAFKKQIVKLDRLELLDRCVQYSQSYSDLENTTDEHISKGIILFSHAKNYCETNEFRVLCNKYLANLEWEQLRRKND